MEAASVLPAWLLTRPPGTLCFEHLGLRSPVGMASHRLLKTGFVVHVSGGTSHTLAKALELFCHTIRLSERELRDLGALVGHLFTATFLSLAPLGVGPPEGPPCLTSAVQM